MNKTSAIELWQEKYRPKCLEDYISLNNYKKIIDDWWSPFNKYYKAYAKYATTANKSPGKKSSGKKQKAPEKIVKKPFLILHGEPGTGKTTLAHCLFRQLNFDVIEINSSDSRNKKLLTEIIETGKRSVVFTEDGNKELGLIMDELDGLTDGESGGASTLVELTVIKDFEDGNLQVRYPVICTTNSIKEKKLKQILDLGVLVHIKQPGIVELIKLGTRINFAEDIGLSPDEIELLATKCVKDYRKLIDSMYQIHLSADKHRELQNIIANIESFSQLAPYANLPIQEITGLLVTHRPYFLRNTEHSINKQQYKYFSDIARGSIIMPTEMTHFVNELESFFYTDTQLFYINLLDNYPGLLEQLFARPFKTADYLPFICPSPNQQKLYNTKYGQYLALMDFMTQNYLATDAYNGWEKIHMDAENIIWNKYTFQDYTILATLFANFKMLNTVNHFVLETPLTSINTVYHSKYNNKKTDSGYYNNNMYNFDKKNPGDPFKFMNELISGDIELLLLAKKSQINEFKTYVVGNTRHTTNLIKKIKNSFTEL